MKNHTFSAKHGQTGFTLLEICVANSLGGMLILLLITFYSLCLRFNVELKTRAQDLENCRFACYFLRHQISQALAVKKLEDNEKHLIKTKPTSDAIYVDILINGRLSNLFFYISENSTLPKSDGDSYSLFMKEKGKPRVELARGIRDMKVLYGIKCPDSLNVCSYMSEFQVRDWSQVISLELFLKGNVFPKMWEIYIALKKKIV